MAELGQETLEKYAHGMDVSGNFLDLVTRVIETDARNNTSRKESTRVKSSLLT